MSFDLERLGLEVTASIKSASWFPFKTGKLKFHATSGAMYTDTCFRIHFSGAVAPYVEYLEEGTRPHDIPRAFGRELPFGIGGRFDGKFHPGSAKHKGFISVKSVDAIVQYVADKYGGEVTVA